MQLTPSSLLKHEKQDDGAMRVMLVAPNLYVGGPGGFFYTSDNRVPPHQPEKHLRAKKILTPQPRVSQRARSGEAIIT